LDRTPGRLSPTEEDKVAVHIHREGGGGGSEREFEAKLSRSIAGKANLILGDLGSQPDLPIIQKSDNGGRQRSTTWTPWIKGGETGRSN